MKNVVIVSGVRTPIGRFGGSLRDVPVYKLASLVLNEAVKRAKTDPVLVDDVIMAQSYQNGECANGARMALLEAGWPNEVPGVTLDRRCCSGLDAIFFRCNENPNRQRRHYRCRRNGQYEPGRTICAGPHKVGPGRKSG